MPRRGMIDRLAVASGRPVSRETFQRAELFVALLKDEAGRQNLISASTLDSLWERHILDSAQLVRFESRPGASWVDIGSGAGLPGLVIALLVRGPVTLVEPRRLRADFLKRAISRLGLDDRVSVAATKAERVTGRFDMISARAVAAVDKLLGISTHLSTGKSLWVLPKGRSARSELAQARRNWQFEAEAAPSCTDADAKIVVLRHVKVKGGR